MRKSWKWALCLGVVSLLLLGGCGKEKTEPVDLVLVTDGSEVASDAVYQSAWNGLAQYGDESGLKYEASVPAGRTTEDYENTIKEAAQKGASVIVCAGTSMSRAVYDAQRDWKDVRFLLLEAEPVSESGRSRLRGNTESLEIDASVADQWMNPKKKHCRPIWKTTVVFPVKFCIVCVCNTVFQFIFCKVGKKTAHHLVCHFLIAHSRKFFHGNIQCWNGGRYK